MDNLTHGLFGLAIGALRRPDRMRTNAPADAGAGAVTGEPAAPRRLSPTDKAVLVACTVAAELPDLDTFWPSGNEVLQALHAHRGPTHSILAAPLVAAVAVLLVRPFFRGARIAPMFAWSLPSVLFGHLLADAWTGWGTRLFLPFSDARLSLDWTLVVDPLVTVPLLAGAVWAYFRRRHGMWRRALLLGFVVASAYVASRAITRSVLIARVGEYYAAASRVEVFPAPFNPVLWRYAVEQEDRYHVGVIRPFGAPVEQATHAATRPELPPELQRIPTVHEALAWARLPLVTHVRREDAGHTLRVADLRYHFGGVPTLAFHFEVGPEGALESTRFDRGGTPRELLQRLRAQDQPSP